MRRLDESGLDGAGAGFAGRELDDHPAFGGLTDMKLVDDPGVPEVGFGTPEQGNLVGEVFDLQHGHGGALRVLLLRLGLADLGEHRA